MEKNTLLCDTMEGLFRKQEGYISFLYHLLLPDAVDTRLISGDVPDDFKNNAAYLFLIEDGEFDILRTGDDVYIASGYGPAIMGLQMLFASFSCHYIRFRKPSVVHVIPIEAASMKIDNADAWQAVTGILASEIKYSVTRDIRSITRAARQDNTRKQLS